MKTVTKTIHNQVITVKPGSVIQFGDSVYDKTEALKEDTTVPCPGWPGAQFRVPSVLGFDIAVNIKITGRTKQYRNDGYWVRVEVEWVGDCEPSTFSKGWLSV